VGLGVHAFFLSMWVADPNRVGADALQIWAQARRIEADVPLYRALPRDYGPDVLIERSYPLLDNSPYLPLPASVVSFFPSARPLPFIYGHLLLMLCCFIGFAAIVARLAWGSWTRAGVLAAHGVLVVFPGPMQMLIDNNIDPLLWCLFGLGFVLPGWRAGLLVLIAGVKPHAIWPLLFLLSREPQRTLRTGGLAVGVMTAVMLAAMGPAGLATALVDWLRFIPPALGQGTFLPYNVSLSFLPIRVATVLGWSYTGGPLPEIARLWLLTATVAAPVAVGLLTRRKRVEVQLASVMAAALLASPLCWLGYLTALLAPVAWWHGQAELPAPGNAASSGGNRA
jgi:hypothetical protein